MLKELYCLKGKTSKFLPIKQGLLELSLVPRPEEEEEEKGLSSSRLACRLHYC